jgi:excinuclease UvrABC ATPase subunit
MGKHIINIGPDSGGNGGGTILVHSDEDADLREALAKAEGIHFERK